MKRKWSMMDLALMGLMTALTIIASRYLKFEPTPWLRLTFSSAFVMLSGIWLGPIGGAVVGGVADLLGCVISGYPPFIPLTLSPIMVGVFSGLCAPVFKKTKNILVCGGVIAVITIITSVFYGSWCMSMLYGNPYWVMVGQRAVQGLVSSILNAVVVYALYRSPVTGMLYNVRVRA